VVRLAAKGLAATAMRWGAWFGIHPTW
jgi:hypothetical protein